MTDNKSTSTIGAGVVGAAIGAAAGIAVTKIMSDPEMKSKATDVLQKAKKYAIDSVQQAKNKKQELQDSTEELASDAKGIGRSLKSAKTL